MRRVRSTALAVAAFLIVGTAFAEGSVSTGIGVNLFRYERAYLNITTTYHHVLQPGLELAMGGEFAIATESDDDGVRPSFVIPVNVGLNFTFPYQNATLVFGTGLTPVFNFNPDTDDAFVFYMGPYVRFGGRLKVHPIMSVYAEYQQDLLIGGSEWINTASRITAGINFALTGN